MAYIGKTIEDQLHLGAGPVLYKRAKELRKGGTEAEGLLWKELRNRKCAGLKFRRQHPLLKFIVDFYCHEKQLIVEVDGSVHDKPEVKERDENRSYELMQAGLTIIRFRNEEIFQDLKNVLKRIADVAESL
jgi:very-short-patch-repair endonuclease